MFDFFFFFFSLLGPFIYPNVEEAASGLPKPIIFYLDTRQDSQHSLQSRCSNVLKFLGMKWEQKWELIPLGLYFRTLGYILFPPLSFLLSGIWGNHLTVDKMTLKET